MDWNTYWKSIKDEYIEKDEGEEYDNIQSIRPDIKLSFTVNDIMKLLQDQSL